MRVQWLVFITSAVFLSLYGASHGAEGDMSLMRQVSLKVQPSVELRAFIPMRQAGVTHVKDVPKPPPVPNTEVREHGSAVCASNAMGHWCWKMGTELSDASALIVLGGHGGYEDPLTTLIDEGYAVWKRNTACASDACDTYGDVEAGMARRNKGALRGFQNNWGYLGYLADRSPLRPVLNSVVFLSLPPHGGLDVTPTEIKEQLELHERTASGFTPIECKAKKVPFGDVAKFTKVFNRASPPRKGTGVRSCLQFIVAGTVVNSLGADFFKKAKDINVGAGVQDAQFFYHSWELIFGGLKREGTVPPLGPSSAAGTFQTSWNRHGIWSWNPSDPASERTLVVIGGSTAHPHVELVRRGVKVWKTRMNCRTAHLTKWGTEYIKDLSHVCTESWGYLQYLADPDKEKATAEYLVFIHGHFESWHQTGDLATVISEAVDCAAVRGKYTPLVPYDLSHYWVREWGRDGTADAWIKMWNAKLGAMPTSQRVPEGVKNLRAWAAASFVLPAAVAAKHPPSFYELALQEKADKGRQGLTGFFFEYTWHLFFDRPPVMGSDEMTLKECPKMTYAVTHPKFIRQRGMKLARMEKRLKEMGL